MILSKTKEKSPLIHAITNPISINQCANTILAMGARPIMAEHPREAYQITAHADALVLNTGNITDVRMKSMKISLAEANKRSIPVVLDVVGVSCSTLRKKYIQKLLNRFSVTIIKGNYSEIYALADSGYSSPGVDAQKTLGKDKVQNAAISLAKKYGGVILASGKEDIITDGEKLYFIKNGTEQLSRITGSGCMLGMLCGCFCAVCTPLEAAITAAAVLGVCGEKSENVHGEGSFFCRLWDNLSVLTDEELTSNLKKEEITIENI